MKHISILVPTGAILGSIEGPRQVFTEVNKFVNRLGTPALFNVKLIGLTKEIPAAGGRYTVYADEVIGNVKKTDLIIIPALDGDMVKAMHDNQDFIPWIVAQYKGGAEVASLCIGAFMLASTGLLNGKKCATHWLMANDFKRMFPDVTLVEDKIITDENGLYSSGGAFSYLNLILYQSQFVMFMGQKDHEDNEIKQAQEYIESNFKAKLTVDQLAGMLALGRRNLERRFKKATSNTVVEYIQRVKIEAAKMNLESSRENVNEVMYNVGYTDTKAFRSTFKKITGLSPIEYRNKYQRETQLN
jgi:transcriptional regulator GlxA family with amidase domain